MAQFNLDVIIDFAGSGETTAQALKAVKNRGRVVVVGMASLEANIDIMTLITKQAEIVGSNGGSANDIAEVYKLIASGDLEPEIIEIGFDEIADGLEKLKSGGIKGRMVAMLN